MHFESTCSSTNMIDDKTNVDIICAINLIIFITFFNMFIWWVALNALQLEVGIILLMLILCAIARFPYYLFMPQSNKILDWCALLLIKIFRPNNNFSVIKPKALHGIFYLMNHYGIIFVENYCIYYIEKQSWSVQHKWVSHIAS